MESISMERANLFALVSATSLLEEMTKALEQHSTAKHKVTNIIDMHSMLYDSGQYQKNYVGYLAAWFDACQEFLEDEELSVIFDSKDIEAIKAERE